MADTHSTTPRTAARPAPAGSRRMVWIGGWAVISIVWLIGAWLYFFTFAPPIRTGGAYAPLSAE
ncbi:MAG: hypothetical protein FJX35_14310 [Alphaproteobacteria bacterium]|nr:hypothetical protein [Alphaproteobacteria bacterium]